EQARLDESIAAILDGQLLAALQSGLPDCAGVALGIDRLLLVAAGAEHLDEVMSIPFETC
ncbi:MAG: amino acid--tRNA ligase-related protein, partial [Thiohalobacterales bacterium]|nr:amino acid--tRNA ligase-related protein [Thiohalobacterales bacterium]